jgi:hypothetical protein
MTTGLINSAIALIAQPRNQRYGSALPYIGKALMAGQQAGQNVYGDALKGFEMQQKLEELKRQNQSREQFNKLVPNLVKNIPAQYKDVQVSGGGYLPSTQGTEAPSFNVSSNYSQPTMEKVMTDPERTSVNPEVALQLALTGDPRSTGVVNALEAYSKFGKGGESPFAKIDPSKFTPKSIALFNQTGNYAVLDPVDKPQLTEAIKNFEYAKNNGYTGSFENWAKSLTPYQLAQLGIDKTQLDLAIQESQYKYNTPQSTMQMPQSVTMQDVADTARSTGKTTSQVIQDLKSKGIKVQGAR